MIIITKLNSSLLSLFVALNLCTIGINIVGSQTLKAAGEPNAAVLPVNQQLLSPTIALSEEQQRLAVELLKKQIEYFDLQIKAQKKASEPAPSLFNRCMLSIITPKEIAAISLLVALVGIDTLTGYSWGPRLIHFVCFYSYEIYGHYASQIQSAALAGGTLGYFHGLGTTIANNGWTGAFGATLSLGRNLAEVLSKIKSIIK